MAHEDKDFFNPEEKRTLKSAGTTPEERASFANNLLGRDPPCSRQHSSGVTVDIDHVNTSANKNGRGKSKTGLGLALKDTFRALHPDAGGVFSYWSVRAGNRPFNRGMRLDYCLASQALVEGNGHRRGADRTGAAVVHDAFVLDADTVGFSDHCPVGLVLRFC